MQSNKKQQKSLFLKHFDLFGVNPKLYINEKEKYKSSWGGFLTISLFLCVIYAFWLYGKDIYYRQNPKTIFTEIVNNHPKRFNITKENFNFAFGLQNRQRANFIDETVYKLKMYQEIVILRIDDNGEQDIEFIHKDINVRSCQQSDFLIDKQFFTEFVGYENMYCIDDYEQIDLHIEGDFGGNYYSNISGKLYPCVNSTESQIICKPKEYIDEMLAENQYTMNFSDQILDSRNYTNPFTSVGRNLYGLVSNQQFTQYLMHFRNVFLEDNIGFMFDDIYLKQGLTFSHDKELVRFHPKEDGSFFQFVVRLEKVKESKIYRTYLTVPAVIAQVGGILKILGILFSFLSCYVSRQMYNLQLVNSIFKFEEDPSNPMSNKFIKSDILKSQQLSQAKQKSETQFEFKQFIYLIFPWCAKKQVKEDKKLFNYAISKINQKLDIHYIIEKLIDIEKIKLLILDKEQHKLFDYIQKPSINHELLNNNQQKLQQKQKIQTSTILDLDFSQKSQSMDKFNNLILLEERSASRKNKEALKAYFNIKNKQNKNQLDYKILDLMDIQMVNIFKSKVHMNMCNSKKQDSINMDNSMKIQSKIVISQASDNSHNVQVCFGTENINTENLNCISSRQIKLQQSQNLKSKGFSSQQILNLMQQQNQTQDNKYQKQQKKYHQSQKQILKSDQSYIENQNENNCMNFSEKQDFKLFDMESQQINEFSQGQDLSILNSETHRSNRILIYNSNRLQSQLTKIADSIEESKYNEDQTSQNNKYIFQN